jgi:hypothetical protein
VLRHLDRALVAARGDLAGSPAGAPPLLEGPAPFVSISPSTVPTGTVSSDPTRIRARIPSAGAGTSVSTLSVETSTIASSASTSSPTCFVHSRIVPSVTDSPIWAW